MSSTPPRQNSHSILQAKIEEAIDKHDNDYSKKRKTSDQNSAEKLKANKQPNLNTLQNKDQQPSPINNPTTQITMEANNISLPKMLRMQVKDLISTKCAAAHSTRDSIISKNAIHPPHPQSYPPQKLP